jgi:surfeit locus 1 family protein
VTAPGSRATRRRPGTLAALGLAAALVFAALVALGTWQVHRLSWKLDLIARTDARVRAPAEPPPGPADWAAVTAEADAYRHVVVRGRFLNDRETLVQAVTDWGAGFWVLTPLRTDAGFTVLVNRGFVPPDRQAEASRPAGQIADETMVTGLLRMTEPKGGFLRSNDPGEGRWYSRDVAAIAAARGIGPVAPYFIDADATPNPGGFPVGGLTVVAFPNNHLVYAFTWYTLAAMLAGAAAWVVRDERRGHAGDASQAPAGPPRPIGT